MKICILIISCLTIQLFSQEVSQSSGSIVVDQDLLPFDFKFYYPPKIYENPLLEYDEIVIPYQRYVQPEIRKYDLPADVISPNLTCGTKSFELMLGQGIDVLAKLNFQFPKSVFDLSFECSNNNVISKTGQENFIRVLSVTNFSYTFSESMLSLRNRLSYYNLLTSLLFLNLNGMFKKVLYETCDITYTPEVYYLFGSDLKKVWLSNSLASNIFFTDRLLVTPEVKFLTLNNKCQRFFVASSVKAKNLFVGTTVTTSFDFDTNFYKLYYSIDLSRKIAKYIFSLSYKKDFYYQYITDYFTYVPGVIFSQQDDLFYPDRTSVVANVQYESGPFHFITEFASYGYEMLPSFIYENGFVKPYFVKGVNINRLSITSKFNYANFNNEVLLSYYSFPECNTYFIPKLTFMLIFNKNISKNLQLSQKFVYQDNLKVNSNYVLPFWLTSTTMVSYKLSNDVNCGINCFIPLINQHYIYPEVHTPAFFQFGIQIKL